MPGLRMRSLPVEVKAQPPVTTMSRSWAGSAVAISERSRVATRSFTIGPWLGTGVGALWLLLGLLAAMIMIRIFPHMRSGMWHFRGTTGVLIAASVASTPTARAQSSTAPGSRPFEIEIMPGHSLRADGAGVYRDGAGGVGAFGLYAITLCSDGRRCSTFPESAPVSATQRTLLLDLTSPVAASGAVARGIVKPAKANFGAFWEQDTTTRATYNGREGWAIRSALDVPVG